MKRSFRIVSLFLAVMSLSAFSSCAKKTTEAVFDDFVLYNVDELVDDKNASYYYRAWKAYTDESAPKRMEVEFLGRKYVCDYNETYIKPPYLTPLNQYSGGEERSGVRFEVDSKTGKLTYILPGNTQMEYERIGWGKAREFADKIAAEYIDINEYYVAQLPNTNVGKDSYPPYEFEYYRKVGGYKTLDAIKIELFSDGGLRAFYAWDVGSFEGIESVRIDEEKASAAVDEQLRQLYGDKMQWYGRRSVELVRISETKFGIFYWIKVEFKSGAAERIPLFLVSK